MIEELLHGHRDRMAKAVERTRDEMVHIRAGKATPNLLDTIKVEVYGSTMLLTQLASVSAPEPRLLVVQPFDKGTTGAIERAILASDLGLNPQNDGRVIRLPIPILTADRREELIKIVKRIAEEGRVVVRNLRRDANETLKKAEKNSEITEDDARKARDQVQKDTDKSIADIDHILKVRENEIREG